MSIPVLDVDYFNDWMTTIEQIITACISKSGPFIATYSSNDRHLDTLSFVTHFLVIETQYSRGGHWPCPSGVIKSPNLSGGNYSLLDVLSLRSDSL